MDPTPLWGNYSFVEVYLKKLSQAIKNKSKLELQKSVRLLCFGGIQFIFVVGYRFGINFFLFSRDSVFLFLFMDNKLKYTIFCGFRTI